jgi:hypothetical protein
VVSRSIPWAAGQYLAHDLALSYVRNPVGDPITITDRRGHEITNTFLDTGELASTTRPSYWTYDGQALVEAGTGGQDDGDARESGASGQQAVGDFGSVKGRSSPGVTSTTRMGPARVLLPTPLE